MESTSQPLVSVPVITYNSSKYVIETLESIKAQTYQNIELIVSDDCSKDNTVDICRKWIEENKERFVRTEIITSDINTGVSANGNRGRNACKGEWIKGIAGDDILLPNCLEVYVKYINEHSEVVYVFSKVEAFGENTGLVDRFNNIIFDYSFFDLSIDEQLKWCVAGPPQPIPAATAFYNRYRLDKLDIYNDERIPMLEDAPKWIRCLRCGIRFHFISEPLVRYRVSQTSICSSQTYITPFRKSLALNYLYYQYPLNIKYIGRIKAYTLYIVNKSIVSNNIVWKLLNKMVDILVKIKKSLRSKY
jgi:alpha-1,3-rhamnosyltransferase